MQTRKINLDKKNISFLAFMTLLGGCSDMDSVALNSSKALAKVNGDSISMNQFNTELNRAHLDSKVDVEIKSKLLSTMIDRQLFVQEASKLNLDRAPEVVEMVNSAKAQIYAQAYLANRIGRLSPPTDNSIAQYIDEHPEIFAHRKVFVTKDIVFYNDPTRMDVKLLQESVTDVESLQLNLKSNNITYNTALGSFSMDVLPTVWVEKLKTANVGNLLFMNDNNKIIVKSIVSITENPMNADEAKDYAKKVLLEEKKQKFITTEISRLRKLSTISILDNKLALTNEAHSNPVDVSNTEPSGKP